MASSSSAEEVKEEHFEVLGPELGRLYHELWNECAWVHFKWDEYRHLYATNPARVEVLNSAAGGFFGPLHDILWQDLLLHLARLVDRSSTGGKDNLTVRRLPDMVNEEIRDGLESLVDAAVVAAGFATDWRNRRIAHRDLKVALAEGAPLESASRERVSKALAALATVLNKVESHYFDTTVMYEHGIGSITGAEHLLYDLRDGVEAEAARRQRRKEGRLDPEDLKTPRSL